MFYVKHTNNRMNRQSKFVTPHFTPAIEPCIVRCRLTPYYLSWTTRG